MAKQPTALPAEGSLLPDNVTSTIAAALARHQRPRVTLDNGVTGRCLLMSIKRCFGVPCARSLCVMMPDGEEIEIEYALYAEV